MEAPETFEQTDYTFTSPSPLLTSDTLINQKAEELRKLKSELQQLRQNYQLTLQAAEELLPIESPLTSPHMTSPSLSKRSADSSKSASEAVLSKDQALYAKLTSRIGSDAMKTLKNIYMKYSTLQSYLSIEKLELYQYHRLLTECRMYTKKLNKTAADLLFYKNNRAKTINFWRFIEIVMVFSKEMYREDEKYNALSNYVVNYLYNNSGLQQENAQILAWEQDLLTPEVIAIQNTKRPVMTAVFELYKTLETFHANRIMLTDFLKFLADFNYIPSLISKPEAAWLVRKIDTAWLFTDSLNFEEFELCCGYIAIFCFRSGRRTKKLELASECVETWYTWLEKNSGKIVDSQSFFRNQAFNLLRSS